MAKTAQSPDADMFCKLRTGTPRATAEVVARVPTDELEPSGDILNGCRKTRRVEVNQVAPNLLEFSHCFHFLLGMKRPSRNLVDPSKLIRNATPYRCFAENARCERRDDSIPEYVIG